MPVDITGTEIVPGSYIVYALAAANSAYLHMARVTAITEKNKGEFNYFILYVSESSWRGLQVYKTYIRSGARIVVINKERFSATSQALLSNDVLSEKEFSKLYEKTGAADEDFLNSYANYLKSKGYKKPKEK